MSFLYFPTHNKPYKLDHIKYRKEKDSLLANHFHHFFHMKVERTSSFTSKGSITLEAALVVPIFFFAMLCLVYLFEIMAIQTTMRNALYSAGKESAQQAYVSSVISTSGVEQHIIKNIGMERLDRSMIVGGANGIDCSQSTSNWNTAVIDLSVCYDLEVPILMFRIPIVSCEETLRIKGWTGYASGAEGSQEKEVVYVTDYGLVYHEDRNCSYLDLSMRAVKVEDVEDLRNQSGGKYYVCESCKNYLGSLGTVYITDYGNRYHTTLDCSKVKRNIYAVLLDEVYGLGGCSKCVK